MSSETGSFEKDDFSQLKTDTFDEKNLQGFTIDSQAIDFGESSVSSSSGDASEVINSFCKEEGATEKETSNICKPSIAPNEDCSVSHEIASEEETNSSTEVEKEDEMKMSKMENAIKRKMESPESTSSKKVKSTKG